LGIQSRYDVVVTVRSEEKGQKILEAHPNTPTEKLSFVIVKDVAADGAFDEVSAFSFLRPSMSLAWSVQQL
jgi:hypothetical protein